GKSAVDSMNASAATQAARNNKQIAYRFADLRIIAGIEYPLALFSSIQVARVRSLKAFIAITPFDWPQDPIFRCGTITANHDDTTRQLHRNLAGRLDSGRES